MADEQTKDNTQLNDDQASAHEEDIGQKVAGEEAGKQENAEPSYDAEHSAEPREYNARPVVNLFGTLLSYAGAAADALAKHGADAAKSGSKAVLKKTASLAADAAGNASKRAYDSAVHRLDEVKIEKSSSELERKLAALGMVVGAKVEELLDGAKVAIEKGKEAFYEIQQISNIEALVPGYVLLENNLYQRLRSAGAESANLSLNDRGFEIEYSRDKKSVKYSHGSSGSPNSGTDIAYNRVEITVSADKGLDAEDLKAINFILFSQIAEDIANCRGNSYSTFSSDSQVEIPYKDAKLKYQATVTKASADNEGEEEGEQREQFSDIKVEYAPKGAGLFSKTTNLPHIKVQQTLVNYDTIDNLADKAGDDDIEIVCGG